MRFEGGNTLYQPLVWHADQKEQIEIATAACMAMEGKLRTLQAALDDETSARADLQAEFISIKARQQVPWSTELDIFSLFVGCGAVITVVQCHTTPSNHKNCIFILRAAWKVVHYHAGEGGQHQEAGEGMAGAGLCGQGRVGHFPLTPQGEQPFCPWHGSVSRV